MMMKEMNILKGLNEKNIRYDIARMKGLGKWMLKN